MIILFSLVLAMAAGDVPAASPPTKERDPDPMVCERIQEVGSLLRSRRVCMRKSEWAEQRRSNKMTIDRAQVQRGVSGGN